MHAFTQHILKKRIVLSWRPVRFGLMAVGLLAASLIIGMKSAFALFLSIAAVAVAQSLAASIALGGGIVNASARLIRLMTGMIVKWAVILIVLLFGILFFRLSVIPLLVGTSIGLVIQFAHLLKLAR